MRRGNKGEWSELYTFLKLLSDGKLHAADASLRKIHDVSYPLMKILKYEQNRKLEYSYTDQLIIVEDAETGESVKIPVNEFKEKSLLLLQKIKSAKGRSFAVEEIEDFLNDIKYGNLKANAANKSDIRIQVHDSYTGMNPALGFSIKSKLGGAPTLLNAGKTTNFIYKISGGMTDSDMNEINTINVRSKIRARLESIKDRGFSLKFNGVSNEMFHLNLQVIDTKLPEILAHLVEYFYSGKGTSMSDLLQIVKKENPCNFNGDLGHTFYEYKIKNFMRDVALGMTPSKRWSGHFDATGGYIIVKENGEVLCYHIYNHNEFQSYLLNNIKLETASSSRHDFGKVYKTKEGYCINLNLQLRFI